MLTLDERIKELRDRWGYAAEGREDFDAAAKVAIQYLDAELGTDQWPLACFVPDGEDGWAFSIVEEDTTSYVHPGHHWGEAGLEHGLCVEWYGTSWEPSVTDLWPPREWTEETRVRDAHAPQGSLHVVRFRKKPGSKAVVRPVVELELEDGQVVTRRIAGDIAHPPRWVLGGAS